VPYVITVKRPCPGCDDGETHERSRRAVAGLEEAREAARDSVYVHIGTSDRWLSFMRTVDDLGESGGTVGPLPDGTVIEVAPRPNRYSLCRMSNVILVMDDVAQRVVDRFTPEQEDAAESYLADLNAADLDAYNERS
jgi:hypothetical protein